MLLKYENKKESHCITVNLSNVFVEDKKIILDPVILKNGLINILKKNKIIRDITFIIYNGIDIPIAKVNIGKLKEYDKIGVYKYLSEVNYI